MTLTIQNIVKLLGSEARLSLLCPDDTTITSLLCDSREILSSTGTLFFALRTSSADGHNFIPELYQAGVRNFVVEDDFTIPKGCEEANYIFTPSSKSALQHLAKGIREDFTQIVSVGITGSRGKTQIKEMLYEILRDFAITVRSPRSFNSQIGVPLSIWELTPETQIGIFEAGISRPREMQVIADLIRPSVGVFTSLTDEHSENFASLEEKALEKALLFKSADVVVYPEGDETILDALNKVNPHCRKVAAPSENYQIAYAAARAVASMSGLVIPERYENIEAISTRIDVLQALKDCLIIFDGFTHDVRSLLDALNFMSKRATHSRSNTVILGAFDLPEDNITNEVYNDVGKMLKARNVSRLIIVGKISKESAAILSSYVPKFEFSIDYRDFMKNYSISDFDSELILVKGSLSQGFDDIAMHLEAPRHETILEVNLNALVNNYNYFKSLLPPSSSLITMVKADAYGVGALEVSKTMQTQGAEMLAVAVVDEGVALRQAGITMPIIVMNPMGTNFKALFDYRLEPSVFSIGELETLLKYAEIYNVIDYPIHLKLDTGMHRVGFTPDEIDDLIKLLNSQNRLRPSSVFSHLATADCPDMNTYTEGQMHLFTQCADKIAQALARPVRRHLLNTAGILRFSEYSSDMARLGIGLYGLSPLPDDHNIHIRNVASLISTIISIHTWPAGTAIGYGRKGMTNAETVIATIPIGYADGLDRRLGNGRASVRVNGVDCPTVGNICMDQCMVDVTNANAKLGDKVVIFDSQADLLRLTDTLGTIPYEILTSISPRVKRIYFRE